MDCNSVKPGMRVRTSEVLQGTGGFIMSQKTLDNRKPNALGTVYGYVPGHGGDVWFVCHDPEEGDTNTFINEKTGKEVYKPEYMAAYGFDEMEPLSPLLPPPAEPEAHTRPTVQMRKVQGP